MKAKSKEGSKAFYLKGKTANETLSWEPVSAPCADKKEQPQVINNINEKKCHLKNIDQNSLLKEVINNQSLLNKTLNLI